MEGIKEFLIERDKNSLLRVLKPLGGRKQGFIYYKGKEYIDFSSNDYLGLSSHPRLKEAAREAIENLGVSSSASRLLSGDLEIHHQLEEKTARFKGKESALIFNSGYQANAGIISALCKKGDIIFSDKLNHASIIDGIILSGAKFMRFKHNDMEHLKYLLENQRHKFKNSLIVTETIFSMDGDRAPLKDIVDLKEKYNCTLMIDEAHATGIFGKNGTGIAEEDGLIEQVDLIMGTFSKALGSFGAYLAAAGEIKEYLINTCRSFIYSTALPPAVTAVNIASLDLVREEPFRRQSLLEKAEYLRGQLKKRGFEVKGSSQIIPLAAGESQRAVDISVELRNKGYWVLPIRPPTVPQGESRVRFTLTYYHTQEILEKLIRDICSTNV